MKRFAEAHKEYTKSVKADLSSLTAAGTAEVARMQGVWGKFKAFLAGGTGGAGGGGGGSGGGGGGGSGKPGANGFMRTNQAIGSAMGIPQWALGMGAATFAAGAVGTLYSSYGAQQSAQNRFALEQPMMSSGVQAELGGMMGGNALSIRHGDLARSFAIAQTKKTAAYGEVTSEHYKKIG